MNPRSHFELLGLAPAFAIDAGALERAYRDLQNRVHPDRHAGATAADKRAAMQWSVRANEAFSTLKDPLRRAAHLLELRGVDLGRESNTAMEPGFLAAQMEWREAAEDARAARNLGALEELRARLRDDRRTRHERLGALLDAGADQPAAEAVRQLMFLDRLEAEIGDAIAVLEDA
ncbi:MAG: Fe-S protein assembly co-chaperone HscB [Burkholderiales bacterium]|nr:Fe-S protein assembly co-chaperone HscB [Burkholderiales bacterium]